MSAKKRTYAFRALAVLLLGIGVVLLATGWQKHKDEGGVFATIYAIGADAVTTVSDAATTAADYASVAYVTATAYAYALYYGVFGTGEG